MHHIRIIDEDENILAEFDIHGCANKAHAYQHAIKAIQTNPDLAETKELIKRLEELGSPIQIDVDYNIVLESDLKKAYKKCQ